MGITISPTSHGRCQAEARRPVLGAQELYGANMVALHQAFGMTTQFPRASLNSCFDCCKLILKGNVSSYLVVLLRGPPWVFREP